MQDDHVGEQDAGNAIEDEQSPEATMTDSALIARPDEVDHEQGSESARHEVSRRPWRAELTRWLLTLNPGRTQDEYAKAIRYFFETPGVPQDLDDLTADLLLAYRGALAMRAERGHTRRSARTTTSQGAARLARLWGHSGGAHTLPGDAASGDPPKPHQSGPLAPATVNIRLTALRQFLRFASVRQPIDALAPERIQLALRRLPVERRRPYQILSEEEWPTFLAAARLPMESLRGGPESPEPPSTSTNVGARSAASPWGRTRAERQRARREDAEKQARTASADADSIDPRPHPARDRRTGALTAQRDYALVALALSTGLRAIELSLLDVGDLTHERRRGRDEWWLTLPDEKTKGQRGGRTLPLAPELVTALLDYIRSTGRSMQMATDRATPLFLALARGPHPAGSETAPLASERMVARRLRPEQIRSVINRIETQWIALQGEETDSSHPGAETRRISPHALRHSAAIALLKGNETAGRPPASVEHVRGWLGHFDIRTTQRYLDHLNSREERRRFAIAPSGFLSVSPQPDAEKESAPAVNDERQAATDV